MHATVFYSWQSDTKAAANRTLIQAALEGATKQLRADASIAVEPVLDRDTSGIPNTPDISTTIFEKIERSTVLVADITIVGRGSNRPAPNPNVLVDLATHSKPSDGRELFLFKTLPLGRPRSYLFIWSKANHDLRFT